jgi:hypothetical protein
VQRHAGPARTHRHSNHPHRVLITRLADGARALPNILCLQALGCNGSSRPLGAMEDGVQRRPPASALAAGAPTRKRSTEKCNHRPMERQTRRRGHAPTVNILAPAIISANFIFLNCNILLQRVMMLMIALLGSAWAVLACPPAPGLCTRPTQWQDPGTTVGACGRASALGSWLPAAMQLRGGGRDGDGPLLAGGAEACPRWPVCGLHEVLCQVSA